jgi:hypothetical protein
MKKFVRSVATTLCAMGACANLAQAQATAASAARQFTVVLGDFTGDLVPDRAVCDPFGTSPLGGTVDLIDGATGATLAQLAAPSGEGAFGAGMATVCDLDGDGLSEVAVGSLLDAASQEPAGILHIYSSATWQEVSYIKDMSQANVTPPDIKVVGDLNDDKLVNEWDVLMILSGLTGEQVAADPYALDVDKNGVVEIGDAVAILNLQGTTTSSACEQTIVAMVNAGEALLNDPSYSGNQTQAGEPIQAGIIGCIICFFKCGDSYKTAADCMTSYRTQMDACWNLPDAFDISQCLDNLRLNFIPTCLANAASAAGNCGKCITKCGPQPSAGT